MTRIRFRHSETLVLTMRRIGPGSSDRRTDGKLGPEKSLRQGAPLLHLCADYSRRWRGRLWLSSLQARARFTVQQAAASSRKAGQRFAPVSISKQSLSEELHRSQSTDLARHAGARLRKRWQTGARKELLLLLHEGQRRDLRVLGVAGRAAAPLRPVFLCRPVTRLDAGVEREGDE